MMGWRCAHTLEAKTFKTLKMTTEDANNFADLIASKLMLTSKEVLTADEAAKYMGMAKSYLYKLIMRGQLAYYKPSGKMVFFKRTELEQWLLSNRYATTEEINERAEEYLNLKGGNYGRK
jgi:excisionase family DNA binding protein